MRMTQETIQYASVIPEGKMAVLSKAEIARLLDASSGGGYDLLRRCALAVLNSGSQIDDGEQMLAYFTV